MRSFGDLWPLFPYPKTIFDRPVGALADIAKFAALVGLPFGEWVSLKLAKREIGVPSTSAPRNRRFHMPAGATGKLWESGDIVALIEAKEVEKPMVRGTYKKRSD